MSTQGQNPSLGPIVLVGCGQVFDAITADPEAYGLMAGQWRSHPLRDVASIAATASEMLATLDATQMRLFVAVDHQALNYARLELYGRARLLGFRLATLIHQSAVISTQAVIADNVYVGPGTLVASGCKIGSDVMVGAGARLDQKVLIGSHTWIGPGCRLGASVSIGAHTVVGTDVTLASGCQVGRHCLIDRSGMNLVEPVAPGTFWESCYSEPAHMIGAGYSHSVGNTAMLSSRSSS